MVGNKQSSRGRQSLTHSQVSDSDQVRSTIAKVVEDFGKIDVFVANAGKFTSI